MFYFINWLFLMVIIIYIYKIRNIKDDMEIKSELVWICILWCFFCFLQYMMFLVS